MTDFNTDWPKTWLNQRIGTQPKPAHCTLPSQFNVGDKVDLILESTSPILGCYIYSVTFAGNGTVSYALSVPIAGSDLFTIVTDVRGCIRPSGSNATYDELEASFANVSEVVEYLEREAKDKDVKDRRSSIHIVSNNQKNEV